MTRKHSHPLFSGSAFSLPFVLCLITIAKVNIIQDKETIVGWGLTKFALMSFDSRQFETLGYPADDNIQSS